MRELGAVKAGRQISQLPADVERSELSVRPRSNYTDHWSILRFGSGLLCGIREWFALLFGSIEVGVCTKSSNKIVVYEQ